jgi:hypothetical protein
MVMNIGRQPESGQRGGFLREDIRIVDYNGVAV